MSKKSKKVPVSVRAVIQRINRKLAPNDQQLKKCRGQRWYSDLGLYYILDVDHNLILDTHLNVESVARELNAIEEWETVVE